MSPTSGTSRSTPNGRKNRTAGGSASPSSASASSRRYSWRHDRAARAIVMTGLLAVLGLAVVVGLTVWNTSGDATSRAGGAAPAGAAGPPSAELGAPVPAANLIRADSHRLAPPAGDRVRVVEFLDLECEACGAAYPTVERLRAEYAGRVDFVARYFPLSGHLNAEPAAFAVEAAARQGRFEDMYTTMYDTQPQWGDQQVDHTATFRGFAQRIGLDMARFDRDVVDPAVRERVLADQADGRAVGVQGTPTFFVNDRPVEGSWSYPALKAAIDEALAAAGPA